MEATGSLSSAAADRSPDRFGTGGEAWFLEERYIEPR